MKDKNLSEAGKLRVPTVTSVQLAEMLELDVSTVRVMEKDGRLPKAVNLTASKKPRYRWHMEDIRNWLKDRSARSGYEAFRPEYLEK